MTQPTKGSFVALLLRERDAFELLLNRVGHARRMTLKGVDGKRSIKDILAHVWAHEQFIAERMGEIAQGQAYTACATESEFDSFLNTNGYPDFDSPLLAEHPSDWIAERFKNVSLEELVAQELEAFASIISVLEGMPEAVLHGHNLYYRIACHTVDLYREQARGIRRWLKTNGVQLK